MRATVKRSKKYGKIKDETIKYKMTQKLFFSFV